MANNFLKLITYTKPQIQEAHKNQKYQSQFDLRQKSKNKLKEQERRECNGIFTVLKGKTHQPRIFHPMKLPFKVKEKKWYSQTKTCSAKTVEKKFLRKKENYIGQRFISTQREGHACARMKCPVMSNSLQPHGL